MAFSDCQQSLSMNAAASKHAQGRGTRERRRNKFLGVRQRASGRWVAEIKGTTQKVRMWLGTFETAEEAARAYDEAACLLRGSNTRTNFATKVSYDSPLAARIRNLLNRRNQSSKPQLVEATNAYSIDGVQQKQWQIAPLGDLGRSPDSWFEQSSTLFHQNLELSKTEYGLSEMSESEIVKVERSFYALDGVPDFYEMLDATNPAAILMPTSSSVSYSLSPSSSSSSTSLSTSSCSFSSLCSAQSSDSSPLLEPSTSPCVSTSNGSGGGSGYLDDIFLEFSPPGHLFC